jgi:predicted N-acetyltransferase YhbS
LRLARLAVSKEAQKRGIGTTLIRYVFAQALEKSLKIGCIGVVVDAKPSAVPFYERLGFERQEAVEGQLPTRPEPLPMFLSIALIKAGIGR